MLEDCKCLKSAVSIHVSKKEVNFKENRDKLSDANSVIYQTKVHFNNLVENLKNVRSQKAEFLFF